MSDQTVLPSDVQGRPASPPHELQDFYSLAMPELERLLLEWGEPRYRARQLWKWAYARGATCFDEMTDIPKELRSRLSARFSLATIESLASVSEPDGSATKFALRLGDGEVVETVLLKERHGYTVCVSCQAGCPLGCVFCATGLAGFRRNLAAGEISYQVVHCAREARRANPRSQISNIVFMGMGEPLLNLDACLEAIDRVCRPEGLGIAPKRITISTVGFPEGIRRLAAHPAPLGLAISLHATSDRVRAMLMPAAGRVPLRDLVAACEEYARRKGARITFEYLLLQGVNDSEADAHRLVSLIGQLPAHVNLLVLNPVPGVELRPASPAAFMLFQRILGRARIPCTIRVSKGVSIGAGCGQLRGALTAH